MSILNKRRTKWRIAYLALLSFLFVAQSSTVFAYAAGASAALKTIRNVTVAIAIPLAGLGAASLGFAFFSGNEKKIQEATSRLKMTAIALAVLLILTALISWGKTLVSSGSLGWNPELEGNVTIIQPHDAVQFQIPSATEEDSSSD